MRLTLVALLALSTPALLALPAPAAAQTERARLEQLLSDIERLPTRPELLQISPRAEALLLEIIQKPSRRVLARSRALAVVRLFPSPATGRVLRESIASLARAPGGLAMIELQQCLSSYAVVAGPASLEVLRPFLVHPSQDVRHAAVGAVALVHGARARQLLEARRRLEGSPMVRHRLERELRALPR